MDYKRIIERKLINVDSKICSLIDELETHDRQWVSDVVIQFLRTFVEHVIARVYAADHPEKEVIIGKDNIQVYNAYIKRCGKYPYLKELLESLNKSVSHFVPEDDGAERLMLMYYANLLHTKRMVKERFGIDLLHNIKKFPVDMDKSLDNYYVAIAAKLFELSAMSDSISNERYYVLGSRPIVVKDEIFYEVTLALARGNISKIDRFVVFSKENIRDNYAIQTALVKHNVGVNGFEMPIQFLLGHRVSIRPCELEKIAAIGGYDIKIKSNSKLYIAMMNQINITGRTLLEELLSEDLDYEQWCIKVNLDTNVKLNECFKRFRNIILSRKPGCNILCYLLFCMRYDVIKDQLAERTNNRLSFLNLVNESIPFDDMPFASSLYGHNLHINHLMQCIETDGREHEFFARQVNDAAYELNKLYLDVEEENFEYYQNLAGIFNHKLYDSKKQRQRKIGNFAKNFCIDYYVEETQKIISKLKEFSDSGIDNYEEDIKFWMDFCVDIDDDAKRNILRKLFKNSRVGLIYGAAGTGKTRVVEYVTNYFENEEILFLAETNSAVDNLRRRTNDMYRYETIYSYVNGKDYRMYDMIVIDECSMVSNQDIYSILEKNNTEKLLLVGDVYQIESIKFGNWFNFARYFLDKNAVHELTTPYRAKDNKNLIEIWNSVRKYDEHMFLKMQNQNCIEDLSDDIFKKKTDDEIVLCLGYNGIYGINNINRFLQGNNPSEAVEWGIWSYKVDDPILFTESRRFGKLLYNNLKGWIVDIEKYDTRIKFVIEIEKYYEEGDFFLSEIDYVDHTDKGNTIISFYVNKDEEHDEDVDNQNEVVPFQIAYAVSIHKAQGLEYDSVKVVITKDIEERISHSIFYTAITRAKKDLKVYMSGEVQTHLVEQFIKDNNGLMQAQKFAGQVGFSIKNRLSN